MDQYFAYKNRFMWLWPQCHSRGIEFFSIISWTIFWQDLTQNLMGQFKICQWVLNVLFLLQIYVCVVIRDTSFCLSLTIIKLMLLQHWTLRQDNPYFKQMLSQIYPIELQLNKGKYLWYWSPLFELVPVYNKWHSFLTSQFLISWWMFLASLLMVYTFRNFFILREFFLMLVTSTKKPFFLKF